MANKNYFSHISLDGYIEVDRISKYSNYSCYGENIAKGQTNPEEVIEAWMNSQGHRANILNSEFAEIGIGYD